MDSDWQNSLTSMQNRNAYILKNGLRSDCCFLVGVISEKQRFFQAHKFLLSSASPVFETMFYGSMAVDGVEPIEIYDIDGDDFFNILQFIYTEEVVLTSVERAQQLYYAATKYMLMQLTKVCIDFLLKNVDCENVCQMYEFAKQFEELNLEEFCIQTFKTKTSDVLKSPCLLLANISTLDEIVSQDNLTISSEIEIFTALEKYAEFRFSIDKRRNSICEICSNCIKNKLSRNENEKEIKTVDHSDDDHDDENYDENHDENVDENFPPKVKKGENSKTLQDKRDYSNREKVENTAEFWKLVKKVRYLTMNAKSFAIGPALSKLISKSDALAILACICEPLNIKTHYPQGFSTSKVIRTIGTTN